MHYMEVRWKENTINLKTVSPPQRYIHINPSPSLQYLGFSSNILQMVNSVWYSIFLLFASVFSIFNFCERPFTEVHVVNRDLLSIYDAVYVA